MPTETGTKVLNGHYEGDGCVPAHFPGLTLLSPECMERLDADLCVLCGKRAIDWIYRGAVLCAACREASPGAALEGKP